MLPHLGDRDALERLDTEIGEIQGRISDITRSLDTTHLHQELRDEQQKKLQDRADLLYQFYINQNKIIKNNKNDIVVLENRLIKLAGVIETLMEKVKSQEKIIEKRTRRCTIIIGVVTAITALSFAAIRLFR